MEEPKGQYMFYGFSITVNYLSMNRGRNLKKKKIPIATTFPYKRRAEVIVFFVRFQSFKISF